MYVTFGEIGLWAKFNRHIHVLVISNFGKAQLILKGRSVLSSNDHLIKTNTIKKLVKLFLISILILVSSIPYFNAAYIINKRDILPLFLYYLLRDKASGGDFMTFLVEEVMWSMVNKVKDLLVKWVLNFSITVSLYYIISQSYFPPVVWLIYIISECSGN